MQEIVNLHNLLQLIPLLVFIIIGLIIAFVIGEVASQIVGRISHKPFGRINNTIVAISALMICFLLRDYITFFYKQYGIAVIIIFNVIVYIIVTTAILYVISIFKKPTLKKL